MCVWSQASLEQTGIIDIPVLHLSPTKSQGKNQFMPADESTLTTRMFQQSQQSRAIRTGLYPFTTPIHCIFSLMFAYSLQNISNAFRKEKPRHSWKLFKKTLRTWLHKQLTVMFPMLSFSLSYLTRMTEGLCVLTPETIQHIYTSALVLLRSNADTMITGRLSTLLCNMCSVMGHYVSMEGSHYYSIVLFNVYFVSPWPYVFVC